MPLSIDDLGRLVLVRRGGRGIRAGAAEIDISPATLSRIERGHMPDLETFAKICRWLDRDPREFLGMDSGEAPPQAVVHFRKKKTVPRETAEALGELILATQRAARARGHLIDQ